jgi:hypothetical protein
MESATWIIVAQLFVIIVVLIVRLLRQTVEHVGIVDIESGEFVRIDHESLFTHDKHTNVATQMSQKGQLIGFAAGLLDLEGGFNGPVLFFRNDNLDGMDFYVDYIVYSWHPHLEQNPLAYVSMIYDSTKPTEFIMIPPSISLNQKYPESAKNNGAFVLSWSGDNPRGMQGSTGGRGVMIFTVQPVFKIINLDGRLIIGHEGTWRFDFNAESAGVLRLGAVGWFSHEI